MNMGFVVSARLSACLDSRIVGRILIKFDTDIMPVEIVHYSCFLIPHNKKYQHERCMNV
jgi:hypothetical protein